MFQRLFAIRTDRDDVATRGRLLKGTCLVVALGTLLDLPVLFTSQSEPGYGWVKWAAIGIIPICALTFFLAGRGMVTVGGLMLGAVGLAFLTATSTPDTILEGPIGMAFVIPILVAGMVAGEIGVVVFWVLSVIILAALQLTAGRDGATVLTVAILLTISATLIWLIIRSIRRMLAYAQTQAAAARQAQAEMTAQKITLQESNDGLRAANAAMERLVSVVRELETPVIPVLEGVLIVPLIGHFDSRRAGTITGALLGAVHDQRARVVIIDITGLSLIDSAVAARLVQLAQAITLLGARPMLTGITAKAAQNLADLDIPLDRIQTAGRLQDGVAAVLATLGAETPAAREPSPPR